MSSNIRTFAEYMPLCEVQKGLRKGEIVEVIKNLFHPFIYINFNCGFQGVLRINPRNYTDAYISAPVILGILRLSTNSSVDIVLLKQSVIRYLFLFYIFFKILLNLIIFIRYTIKRRADSTYTLEE